ncbi:MAG: glycoside hydrolase [Crocinitomicaceae bacterium]
MRKLLLSILLFSCFCGFAGENILFKGVSFSAANKTTTSKDIKPIATINANWISIVPYGFLKDHEVVYDSKFQWVGERPEAIKACVKLAKDQGLKVMIKPHIWIGHNSYTGIYSCETEAQWEKFESSYKKYIMTFVDLAVSEKVEMFSIGTEWGKFVEARPQFWKDLIKEIRTKYTGKLIYAANWDDYQKVPFWNQLDYIGIDSYFPLSLVENPKMSELIKSWKTIMPLLEQYSSSKKKKIVFTEFGFKSTSKATISPWEHKDDGKFSEKVQDMAFRSFFQTIWKKPWFKGGFIWKWYHNHEHAGGRGDTDFTPQNKLAEETIQKFYGE